MIDLTMPLCGVRLVHYQDKGYIMKKDHLLARYLLVSLILAFSAAPMSGQGSLPYKRLRQKLRKYPNKYYLLYADLPKAKVLEASARLSAMAVAYHDRTRAF